MTDIHEELTTIRKEIASRHETIRKLHQEIKTRRNSVSIEQQTIKELKQKYRDLIFSQFKER